MSQDIPDQHGGSHERMNDVTGCVAACKRHFSQAYKDDLDNTDPDGCYVNEVITDDGVIAFEGILLTRGPEEMPLYRSKSENTFPYWLEVTLDGRDLETGEPVTVARKFALDPMGIFHEVVEHRGRDVTMDINEAFQDRLVDFLTHSEPDVMTTASRRITSESP